MKKIYTIALILLLSGILVVSSSYAQPTVEKILADFEKKFPIYIKAHQKAQTVKEFSVVEKNLTLEGTTLSRVNINAADYMEYVVDMPPEMVPFISSNKGHLVYMKDSMFVWSRGVCVFGFHARAYSDQPRKMVGDVHRFQWFPLAATQDAKDLKFPTKEEVSLPAGFHTIGEPKATGYGEAEYGNSWKIELQDINGNNQIVDLSEEEIWFIKNYQNCLLYVPVNDPLLLSSDFKRFKIAQQKVDQKKRQETILINLESYLRGGRGMIRYYFLWLYPQ